VAQCEQFAADKANSDSQQDGAFAACMVSRGYRATVPLPSAGEVVAGRIGVVGGTDSTQIRPHSPKSQDLEAQVSICLAARGYTARPSPSGQ
jgi:hypothetical protein